MKQGTLTTALGCILSLALTLALVSWVYSPGVSGPALLDDYSSLGALGNLSDTPEQAWDYVLGDNSGPLGRSVSMSTFVAEKLVTDGSITTTKWVNIAIHLVNGVLVAVLLLLLVSREEVKGGYYAAVLAAAVWMVAPLQVSTVLYLVQRMAMLAATFSLLSMIFYLVWRRNLHRGAYNHFWLLPVFLSLTLGIFSKENAVVTVPLVLLLEVCWLQFKSADGHVIIWLRRGVYGLILLGLCLVFGLIAMSWTELATRYSGREFTLEERIMTQPRVLWDYVRQFYFSDLQRLGIFHDDFSVSTSLFSPQSTLGAIAGWLGVFILCLVIWRWPAGRRIALGPLFFLAGHSIESTVWPLELYFEHRNYLPSVGLSILILSLFSLLVQKWLEVSKPLLAWILVYAVFLVLQTSSQVQIWSSAPLLAMQHVSAHPNSARANKEFATHLAKVGAIDGALEYSRRAYLAGNEEKAASDEHHGDYILRNVALACIAKVPLKAAAYQELGMQQRSRPLGEVATMTVVAKLRHSEQCSEFDWSGFLEHLANLYLTDFDVSLASANMWSALAMLANAEQRWSYAYEFNKRNLALVPSNIRGLLMQLHFSTALGKEGEARGLITELQQLKEAGKLNQGERDTLALYVEN